VWKKLTMFLYAKDQVCKVFRINKKKIYAKPEPHRTAGILIKGTS